MSVVAARNLKRIEANLAILPEGPGAERAELTTDAAAWRRALTALGDPAAGRLEALARGSGNTGPRSHYGQGGPLLFKDNFVSVRFLHSP